MILFAAAESSPYEAINDTRQAVTSQDNEDDTCNPSKMAIKCCICLNTLAKYLPIINALIDKKINAICRANKLLWAPCKILAKKIKKKVFKGFFPGLSPRKSCVKYKMC
ncbi:hypothetical protein G5714_017014 [Onychostoma macrolepis]|uniref:Saposin B-type domain-containing protein n=1 Tax=Onychostoma macrolepis TaxID=369639 RepID=A0A7J6C5D8_9TELE|nr:hypothetical protein G5714_017014 [Onychostoma macrolepis]